jgi:hypothetical protein
VVADTIEQARRIVLSGLRETVRLED